MILGSLSVSEKIHRWITGIYLIPTYIILYYIFATVNINDNNVFYLNAILMILSIKQG